MQKGLLFHYYLLEGEEEEEESITSLLLLCRLSLPLAHTLCVFLSLACLCPSTYIHTFRQDRQTEDKAAFSVFGGSNLQIAAGVKGFERLID